MPPFPKPPKNADDAYRQMEELRARIDRARTTKFERDNSDFSYRKPWADEQERYDATVKIRDLTSAFQKLTKIANDLAEAEKKRKDAMEAAESFHRSSQDALFAAIGGHGGEAGRVAAGGYRLGRTMASYREAKESAAQAGVPFKGGKGGIIGAAIGLADDVGNMVASGFSVQNRRNALEGDMKAALFRSDAIGSFVASTERTAAVMEKIPIAGKAVAEAFRSTAVEMQAFQKRLQGFGERAEELGRFNGRIANALAQARVRKMQADIREANQYGSEYAAGVEAKSRFEIDQQRATLPGRISEIKALREEMPRWTQKLGKFAGEFGEAAKGVGDAMETATEAQKKEMERLTKELGRVMGNPKDRDRVAKDIRSLVAEILRRKREEERGAVGQFLDAANKFFIRDNRVDPVGQAAAQNIGFPLLNQ